MTKVEIKRIKGRWQRRYNVLTPPTDGVSVPKDRRTKAEIPKTTKEELLINNPSWSLLASPGLLVPPGLSWSLLVSPGLSCLLASLARCTHTWGPSRRERDRKRAAKEEQKSSRRAAAERDRVDEQRRPNETKDALVRKKSRKY